MKLVLLFIAMLLMGNLAHAEGNCPPGYAPSGVGPGGVQGCAPLPGANSSGKAEQGGVWEDRFGAVATDPHLAILGSSHNMDSRRQAENSALADCKSQGGLSCKLDGWYRNGCAAMVAGHGGYSTSTADNQDTAIDKAMKDCQAGGYTNCHVYYTGCSSPQRVR